MLTIFKEYIYNNKYICLIADNRIENTKEFDMKSGAD